jgi:hypothetical protein
MFYKEAIEYATGLSNLQPDIAYKILDDGDGVYIAEWFVQGVTQPTEQEINAALSIIENNCICCECHDKLVENHLNFFCTSTQTNYGWYKCDTQRMSEFSDIYIGTVNQGLSFNVLRDDLGVSRQLTVAQLADWLQELRMIKQISFFKKRQIEAALLAAVGEAKRSIPLEITVSLQELNYYKSLTAQEIEAILIQTIGV